MKNKLHNSAAFWAHIQKSRFGTLDITSTFVVYIYMYYDNVVLTPALQTRAEASGIPADERAKAAGRGGRINEVSAGVQRTSAARTITQF